MKKLLVLFFLATSLVCFGQGKNSLNDISSVKFYGIDFSKAKVYGAAETELQFRNAFDEINKLFISEPKKFNIQKHTGLEVTEISLDAVNELNKKINLEELKTTNKNYILSEEQIAEAIKTLPVASTPGTGLVILGMLLDKASNSGCYQFVIFDTQSKAIINQWTANGKAGGFGLRNFWAASVYKALKK
ncbi:MAG: hypothetical protein EOM31_03035 [Bacteroidia bacterium]|nr:hypothetical protein [Bacteroidia bacterium]